jgi:hypothetical protein
MSFEYLDLFTDGILYYLGIYFKYIGFLWSKMTPEAYGIILISVAVGGWFMMKSANNK